MALSLYGVALLAAAVWVWRTQAGSFATTLLGIGVGKLNLRVGCGRCSKACAEEIG